ncbi:MAG TPA: NADP-dependent isocitrate dehydrogenase [Dehalococcoidia bacterium]|nr:NADP-dependent isocitrate dehydrogenase [Dehalococcoidia bacterium]
MTNSPTIIYTWTDEAPALATYAFLPIVSAFAGAAGVQIETRDISLAGRVLAQFPEVLKDGQPFPDDLTELGELTEEPGANIIKLPNISASIPQMKACIAELQERGLALPEYPEAPANDEERQTKARFDVAMGSAVNPVLREGNSDRRAPKAVKDFAKANPPRMRAWPVGSRTHVSTMSAGDFRNNEKSVTIPDTMTAKIEHVAADGTTTVLMESLPLVAGEVLDGTFMSKNALVDFYREQVRDARDRGVLFSLHLKATMMKVSDPIIFGHAVEAFYGKAFANHAATFEALGIDANNGVGDLLAKISDLQGDKRSAIEADIQAAYDEGPGIAMVDSDRGITNLHVPSDVIVDASIPPMIRDSGGMWNADGVLQDTKAIIPDSSYAGIYDAIIKDVQKHGQLDPTAMGSVPNVGLMAQKAEEYGSHDKTFEAHAAGTIKVVDGNGNTLIEHAVEAGDIWRACQTKDVSVRNWVELAVRRAGATGAPAVFWLDTTRAHDAQLINKVNSYLADHDTSGLEVQILDPVRAIQFSLDRIRRGEDTISVTGNVLRDYLTDLFPILELGTSARMLSIVPLLNGGGLFETGAGGSAPKHVQQFEQEGHLRWDSIGEYMALAASLQHLADTFDNAGAGVVSDALDNATAAYLDNARLPSRVVRELDSRGSTFYLALYWAQAMRNQDKDPELAEHFAGIAKDLAENEETILAELIEAQGSSQELGGYYMPDTRLVTAAMRPSKTFNRIIDGI